MKAQTFIGEFCDQSWSLTLQTDDLGIERILRTPAGLDHSCVVAVAGEKARGIFPAIPLASNKEVVGFHATSECPACLERHPFWLPSVVRAVL